MSVVSLNRLAVLTSLSTIATTNKYVAYGSLYLTVPGVYATAPITSAWMANNSEPYYRRATSLACGLVLTNIVGQHIHVMGVRL